MFCERTHCALILMVELAQHYGAKGIDIEHVAHLHNLPAEDVQEVAERLEESNFIVRKGEDKLSLKISPEKITIWQVVECVSAKEALACEKLSPRQISTSTVIMIRKADEALESIISSKLKQYKLSEWGEKASKTVYI